MKTFHQIASPKTVNTSTAGTPCVPEDSLNKQSSMTLDSYRANKALLQKRIPDSEKPVKIENVGSAINKHRVSNISIDAPP